MDESTMGNFDYALSKMREGGVVRRRIWDPELAIMMDSDQNYIWAKATWTGPRPDAPAGLRDEDLEAEYWELCGGYCL